MMRWVSKAAARYYSLQAVPETPCSYLTLHQVNVHATPTSTRLTCNSPRQHIVVPRQVLGGRVHHQVHAQLERLIVDGRGKRGVDRHQAAPGMAQFHDPWYVQAAQQGVGG